jgi:hypothetical protein
MRFLSVKAHTVIGIIIGVLLLFAPSIFGFIDSTAATTVAQLTGIFIILSELITVSPFGLLRLVPMRAHLVLDYITGIFLALSPWLFGFYNLSANVWVPHLIVGILVVGYALATNPALDTASEKTAIVR